jgi:hypothetical protein
MIDIWQIRMDLMFRVEKVDEDNKQQIINFLKLDVVKHVFAVYDLQHDPNHTHPDFHKSGW